MKSFVTLIDEINNISSIDDIIVLIRSLHAH